MLSLKYYNTLMSNFDSELKLYNSREFILT